jgi:benzoylformate decarboxylase
MAEKLGVPVACDRPAYCNFPAHHPLNVGPFSTESAWIKNADLLFFIGARDAGGKLVPLTPELSSTQTIIRMGLDTGSMGRNYATDIALVGDIRSSLRDLSDAVGTTGSANKERADAVKAATKASRAKLLATIKANSGRSPIHPDELGAVLARSLNKDAIIVAENLTGKYESFAFGYQEDQQQYFTNLGLGLGWGVGAATGAKLAAPDRQVVNTIGDGSVMYSASGFWTQARYHIPVLTVVYNNKNYQTVRHAYHTYQGKMASSNKYVGMYLGDPDIDFVQLAGSQGVKGEKAATANELEAAIKRGAKATGDGNPYVIEVATARFGGGAESTWHEGFSFADTRKRKV